MSPYKVISEDATHITYEYRSAYTWTLYTALIVVLVGAILSNDAAMLAGGVAVGVYFAVKLTLGCEVMARIKKAVESNSVQLSGNKSSFTNPLRIRVPK